MKRGRAFQSLLALGVCLGGVASLGASPSAIVPSEENPSLRDLVRSWTRSTPSPSARPGSDPVSSSRADAIAALNGGRKATSRCAAPLLMALHQNSSRLNQPTRLLLERATRLQAPIASSSRPSAGGEFRIHYWIDRLSADQVDSYDGDLNGVPDGVDRLAAEFTDVLANFVHLLNWAPAPAASSPIEGSPAERTVDVYLVALSGPSGALDGFVMPSPATMAAARLSPDEMPEASDSVIFLDTRFATPAASSRSAVAHMIAHMIQMRESVRESPWWHEASATWLENRLERNAATVAKLVGSSPARSSQGLIEDLAGLNLEAFLWPHYLTLSSGSDATLLRRFWEEMAAVPGNNTLDALDRVLRRTMGTTLQDEIKIFNVWNLFIGQADDGQHYPFGSHLPTPQGDGTFELFPVRGASLSGPVMPLGAALVRLLGDASPGGLHLRFFGGDPGRWDVSLIVHSASRPGDVRYVPVEVDSAGRGVISFPWRSLATIDVLIQNLGAPGAAPADYSFAIDYDPLVPYDLLSLTAAESAGSAELSWSTESEERLAGWNIYRGPGPLGPFSRINQYLVPGAGRAGQPMSYIFVDSSVQAGRKYYYYLEGVTFEGFTEDSHPAGVRLGRTPTSPSR